MVCCINDLFVKLCSQVNIFAPNCSKRINTKRQRVDITCITVYLYVEVLIAQCTGALPR